MTGTTLPTPAPDLKQPQGSVRPPRGGKHPTPTRRGRGPARGPEANIDYTEPGVPTRYRVRVWRPPSTDRARGRTRAIRTRGIRHAAIAHLGQDAPTLMPLRAGDVLVVNASRAAVRAHLTSPVALAYYVDAGVRVLSSPNLHANVIATDRRAVIGSRQRLPQLHPRRGGRGHYRPPRHCRRRAEVHRRHRRDHRGRSSRPANGGTGVWLVS